MCRVLGYCAADAEGYWRGLTCRKEQPDPLVLDAIRDAVDRHAVFVFVKPGCGYCERAMELLSKFYPDAKARYRVGSTRPYRIGLARALGIAPGNISFPAEWIRGSYVGGADDLSRLHAAGLLEERLREPSRDGTMGSGLPKSKPNSAPAGWQPRTLADRRTLPSVNKQMVLLSDEKLCSGHSDHVRLPCRDFGYGTYMPRAGNWC